MDLIFVSSVVLISATGALSPGPLTAAAVALGINLGWRAGLLVALGHTLVELPYVILLAVLYNSISPFIQYYVVRYALSLLIASFNLFFAYLLLNDAIRYGKRGSTIGSDVVNKLRNPLIVGLTLTGLNPFFLIWWATVGMQLINSSILRYGLAGIPIMYVLHVWLDYVWLIFITYTVHTSSKYLSLKGYKLLLIALALMLIVFAINILAITFFSHPIVPL